MAEPEEECCRCMLTDQPEHVLLIILRQLDGRALASLCVQDRRLAEVAGQQFLWEALAEARWPTCSANHYDGDWKHLYGSRAELSPGLVTCIDKCHVLTEKASGRHVRLNSASLSAGNSPSASPQKQNVYGFATLPFNSIPDMMCEQLMQTVFNIGLAPSSFRNSCEHKLHKQDIAWWCCHKPQAIISFAKRTTAMLLEVDMWGTPYVQWPDVPWRRSALQFVVDMGLGPHQDVCLSVMERLASEVRQLDNAIHEAVRSKACQLEVQRIKNVPRSHWWYWLSGPNAD